MTSIATWVDNWAEHRPSHPAILFEDEVITYADMASRVDGAASALVEAGITRGDRVAWLGLNQPICIHLGFAAARIGAVFVPLNNRLAVPEIQFQLDHCSVSLLIADTQFGDRARAAARGITVIEVDGPLTGESEVEDVGRPDDPYLLVYTSGTTGRPKGALHTQSTIAATIENSVACQDLTQDDVSLMALPLFHVGGMNIQTLPLIRVGGTTVLHRSFDASEYLLDIERRRPTVSVLVPAMISALVGHPLWGETDMTSLRGVVTGSSVVPEPLLKALASAGLRAGQIYGATETGPTSIALRFEDAAQLGSCGRPVPGTDARLASSGELEVRGPHLFTEYWNDPIATSEAFHDGWFRTGDVAHLDANGWYFIVDRLTSVIISGGENVYPAEVEAVLENAAGVAEISVVGFADDRWGETPVAFVVCESGRDVTLEDLRAFGGEKLARFKLPTRIVLVEALPKTALGKVQKFELSATIDG